MNYYHYKLEKTKVSEAPTEKFNQTEKAAAMIRELCFNDGSIEIYESAWLILLNRNLNLKGIVKIGQGGITGCVVDVRLICKYAIESLATGCIISHNHPSGNIFPSVSDKNLTNQVKNALNTLSIELHDHFIITANEYYSFAENGTL
jgi:DNA repair protein RadC